jgi:hypothetical protein
MGSYRVSNTKVLVMLETTKSAIVLLIDEGEERFKMGLLSRYVLSFSGKRRPDVALLVLVDEEARRRINLLIAYLL